MKMYQRMQSTAKHVHKMHNTHTQRVKPNMRYPPFYLSITAYPQRQAYERDIRDSMRWTCLQ